MTMITEYRLECEYCGVSSPTLGAADWPRGWVVAGKAWRNPNPAMEDGHHFCCDLHRQKWLAEQEQTA